MPPRVTPEAAVLAAAVGRLLAELEAAGVPDPLGQPLLLAAVLADLFRLLDAPPPAMVAARLGGVR